MTFYKGGEFDRCNISDMIYNYYKYCYIVSKYYVNILFINFLYWSILTNIYYGSNLFTAITGLTNFLIDNIYVYLYIYLVINVIYAFYKFRFILNMFYATDILQFSTIKIVKYPTSAKDILVQFMIYFSYCIAIVLSLFSILNTYSILYTIITVHINNDANILNEIQYGNIAIYYSINATILYIISMIDSNLLYTYV